MAKRPSLRGAGREALAAATGQKPAAEARPSEEKLARVHEQSHPEKEVSASDRLELGSAPPAGGLADNSTPKVPELKGAAALYCEMLGFGRERMSQTLEATRMLGACRTPAEVLDTQAQLARRATEQCVRESFRMMELSARAIGEGWASMQILGTALAARDMRRPK
jgi:phasin protein